ncbi:MAG: hypothetical protein HUU56_14965 [Bdellovibrionaceae bacterium]|nr:hypothetical protein [Pseudobdellovibrionaceae bacterium]
MDSVEKIKIDFVGAGKVVQQFLEKKNFNIDIRIYDQPGKKKLDKLARSIKIFKTSGRILLLCASTDEESILKTSHSHARLSIAKENLAITNDLIQKGIFKDQIIFVLTNPSEIIAEFIYRKTGNKRVYALGLNTDQKRYSEIIKQSNFLHLNSEFYISGNHYDFPYPMFHPPDSTHDEKTTIQLLYLALQKKIQSEFKGYRPPIVSGVTALNDLIQSLATKRPLYLSGYCDEFGCFTGGRMDFTSLNFTPLLGNTCYSKKKILSIAKKHCESYFSATSNQEHKE